MPNRSVAHATFTVERSYPTSPDRVFAGFADRELKSRWYGPPEDWSGPHTMFEFEEGGREHHRAEMDGRMHVFDGRFHDIVPGQRIVFSYDMYVDDARISASLATVELTADGDGTRLVYTEQGAFLDGYDVPASREGGMGSLLDALGEVVTERAASASS